MQPLGILVIDDEPVICNACRMILGEAGHRIDHCLTGGEGLHAIARSDYDVLLLDIKLPDMDGFEILKAVRNKTAGPCVIVMSGLSTMANALQAMKLGAVDYLAKPFTEDELMEAIRKSCQGRLPAQGVDRIERSPQQPAGNALAGPVPPKPGK